MQLVRPARVPRADPMLLAYAAAAVIPIAWLLCGPGGLAAQVLTRAVVGTGFHAVVVVCGLLLARRPGLAAAERRFWHAMAGMGVLFVLGNLSRLVVTVRRPDASVVAAGHVQTICVLAGVVVLLIAVLSYRVPWASREARLRYLLDAVSVVAAATVVIWFMTERSAALGIDTSATVGAVVVAVVLTVTVTRLTLSGHSPISSLAALPVIVSALLTCLNGAVLPVAAGHRTQLTLHVAAAALVGAGPLMQLRANRRADHGRPERRRWYGVLPCLMLGVVFGVLPATLPGRLTTSTLVVVGGLVVITALLVTRQLVSNAESASLVRRLDASLDTLGRQEERVRLMMEYSTDVTLLIDATGAMVYASTAIRLLGHEPADLLGVRVLTLIHPDDLPPLQPDLQRLMTTPGSTFSYQARYRHGDGSWCWLEVTSRNLIHVPSVNAVVSNARDVTESRELQNRLRHEATHDALTGLANRVLFGDRLTAAMADGVGLLHIDLDGFKPINDTYGHHIGDVVLTEVAQRLRAVLPARAVPARLGGDEFAVLIPEAGKCEADLAADRFRAALDRPIEADGRSLSVAASIGVVAGVGVAAEALLREADEAMYRVKHAARAA